MEQTTQNRLNPVPVAEDPALSKDVKAFLKALNAPGGPGLETLTPEEARGVLTAAQKSVDVDYTGIEETEKVIAADGFSIKLNIVRPAGGENILPAYLFIHGGGWVLGDYATHKRMVRDLTVLSGAVGIFVNYTPSPEARYPQAIEEIYAALKWIAGNGNQIGIDGDRLAIVGNSVGGNMSAVTAIRAKEQDGPKLKVQILMWPVTSATFNWESYAKFGEERFLTTPLMKWMFDNYTIDSKEREQPYLSPLNASSEQLQGLPPAIIQVAEADILRDQGEAYGRKLDEAGVPVTTIRYNGMIHDFGLLNPLAHLPQVRVLFEQAAYQLKKYLLL